MSGGVSKALYRSLLQRMARGRLRELLDTVPFRIPTTALTLCGEEAFVAAGQPIPTLRYDPHGPPVSLAPPPIATDSKINIHFFIYSFLFELSLQRIKLVQRFPRRQRIHVNRP